MIDECRLLQVYDRVRKLLDTELLPERMQGDQSSVNEPMADPLVSLDGPEKIPRANSASEHSSVLGEHE
jgi:hypothetical protein